MIINFEIWENRWVDSEVLSYVKSFMTFDVDFKNFLINILTLTNF